MVMNGAAAMAEESTTVMELCPSIIQKSQEILQLVIIYEYVMVITVVESIITGAAAFMPTAFRISYITVQMITMTFGAMI